MAADLADGTATELLARYRRGEALPVEATRAALNRVDERNGPSRTIDPTARGGRSGAGGVVQTGWVRLGCVG
jgi:hypothetical protein